MKIRKVLVVSEFPNEKIEAKVKALFPDALTVNDGDGTETFNATLTDRNQLRDFTSADSLARAPKTQAFLAEVVETARAAGAFYILVK